MNTDIYKVKARDLCKSCPPSMFKFNTTAEVKPLKGIIGQERAVRSLEFALDMNNEGYNVYLSGAYGTGKTTLARELLEKKACHQPVPSDWCYVYNFKQADAPRALELAAGLGREFQKDVAGGMDLLIQQTLKTLSGQDFDFKKSEILNGFMEETNQMYLRLEEESRAFGFTISRTNNGVSSIPLKDGQALSQEDYSAMTEDERLDLLKRGTVIQEKINSSIRQYKELEKSVKEKIKALELETVRLVTGPYFSDLLAKYAHYPEICSYLNDMQEDVIANLDVFARRGKLTIEFSAEWDKKGAIDGYRVTLR